MTPTEHQLIIEMFKQQTRLWAGIVEVLRTHSLVEKGDLQAFAALVSSSSGRGLEEKIEEDYRTRAKILGLTGPL